MECAEQELEKQDERVNVSRLSVITGLHRRDADRIFRDREAKPARAVPIAERVINQWRNNKRFLTASGKPRVLSHKGQDNEFKELIEAVSTHLSPGTVLFELERAGAIEQTKNGVKLLTSVYVPRKQPEESLELIASDAEDLIQASLDNLEAQDKFPNYQVLVYYDNIDDQDLSSIRKWLFDRCYKFHQQVDKFLSKYDLDLYPDPKRKGGNRVAVGLYSRTT